MNWSVVGLTETRSTGSAAAGRALERRDDGAGRGEVDARGDGHAALVPAAIVAMPTLLSNRTLPTVRRAVPLLGPPVVA